MLKLNVNFIEGQKTNGVLKDAKKSEFVWFCCVFNSLGADLTVTRQPFKI